MSKSTPRDMRALFDTNVYISYLLPSKEGSAIEEIVRAAFEERFTLLMAQEIADEFAGKVARKRYLANRISREEAERLMQAILDVAEVITAISTVTPKLPVVTRDVKDDYLLAYALIGEADYLVTGDADLLVLQEIEGVRIVTPAAFLSILEDLPPNDNPGAERPLP